MKNLFSKLVKIKSKTPKNAATNKEIAITNIVKIVDCLVVGHDTCFNSPRVSFIY
jgi:hypothetical protein